MFLPLLETGSYASSEMTFGGVCPRLWSKVDQVLCQCDVGQSEGSSISPPHCAFICRAMVRHGTEMARDEGTGVLPTDLTPL